ncbi:related to MMS21 - SUMO ligase and component of the SMC5-SMC6 complex [Pseudozyma flocculosa]|uniref:Related to MMS21 - SUMO ligase and component of the SMC5-SMC6 complex n=1 Tax=Pseudozyma flocculosa TaxID=84751 RepID=A0A5C3F8V7_9BASI|nr:related to MMS21 - SUMO ligase and component of the SMC5-SMC6 complex [Pseudozyma flocculosa]
MPEATKLKPQAAAPLDRDSAAAVGQMIAGYGPHEDTIRQAMASLEEATSDLCEVEETIDNEAFVQLDADYRELVDAQAEAKTRKTSLEALLRRLEGEPTVLDPATEYSNLTCEQLEAYSALTTRKKYGQSQEYVSFRESAWAAVEDSAMPPINEFLPAEQGDEDDDDDDIQVGGTRQDYKCPYSAKLLIDPVSSTGCPHSYDRESILSYVGKGEKVCPASACNVKLSHRSLKPDPRLAKRVAAYRRREESRILSAPGTMIE